MAGFLNSLICSEGEFGAGVFFFSTVVFISPLGAASTESTFTSATEAVHEKQNDHLQPTVAASCVWRQSQPSLQHVWSRVYFKA